MKTVLIGAGNVATHLGEALQKAGCEILQVWSRTRSSAETLADRLGCAWTTDVEEVSSDAEMYLFSVSDAMLEALSRQVFDVITASDVERQGKETGAHALFVHTAGSMSQDVLPAERRGVMYPLQTFSRKRSVDFTEIPIFIESRTDEEQLMMLAELISNRVWALDEVNRRYIHLAAVFACNFTNHLYDLAARLLSERGIPFSALWPLIDETARKVHDMQPSEAQTGPAVRHDMNVIGKHLDMLSDEKMKEIYTLLTESIYDRLRPDED
ncbi:MAG: DUF2520 domain-containing protein [Bacteroidaceae bacterium]|nr:DUF2520 domain-containing protein [Bacteroidaceae bacterium]